MGTTTRLLAVAGDPVAHSLSPAMHNAAIAAMGLDAVYVAARTTPRAFPGLVHALLEAGGALNVTVPFKRQAAGLVDRPTELVTRTGACNTIWGTGDEAFGDNTDVVGVRTAARALMEGKAVERAVIVGTGGSARATAVALTDEWPGVAVEIMSRTREHAEEFLAWGLASGVNMASCKGRFDGSQQLAVNCTPIGLDGGAEIPFMWKGAGEGPRIALLDLVYAPGGTAWVRWAHRVGQPAVDGRGVLVAQGAAAFERFFGVQPPIEVMRAAVEDALR